MPQVKELISYEIHRIRVIYAFAEKGIDLLVPSGRDCVRTALTPHCGILNQIESAVHQILDLQVAVGTSRWLRVALPAYVHAGRTLNRRPRAQAPDRGTTPIRRWAS